MGPGFDSLGLAITGFGDKVCGKIIDTKTHGVSIRASSRSNYPLEPWANTASVAANWVLTRANVRCALELEIFKGIPLGSGIGGSAASAAAGAIATNLLIGQPFTNAELVSAVLEGESVASGVEHGDNVLPSLFGGLCLVSPEDPRQYSRLHVAEGLKIVIVIPDLQIMTSSARMILPQAVAHADAVRNGANLAFLVSAFGTGNWPLAGRSIMTDRLAEPYRARLLHGYDHIKQAALSAGAYGAALSGSGPAMFAICDDDTVADAVLHAMKNACNDSGMSAIGAVVEADREGTRRIDE